MRDINAQHNRVIELLKRNRIKDALTILKREATELNDNFFITAINQIEDNYKTIGEYLFKGVNDPDRGEVISNLKVNVLKVNDHIKHYSFNENIKKLYPDFLTVNISLQSEDDVDDLLADLSLSIELSDIFTEVSRVNSLNSHHLFNHLLITYRMSEYEMKLLNKINTSTNISYVDKSLMVSAITLSLMISFDENKFKILLDYYLQQENLVWQRALTGLIINLYIYDYKINNSKILKNIIFQLSENEVVEKDIENIILQFYRSKDTDKVSKKMKEEIIPEMMKLRPDLEDKMGLNNLLKEEDEENDEEKNPLWETYFKDTPDLADKIEEISKLQQSGADIYMSAFSQLKHFDFFNKLSNWMIPFYADNNALENVFPDNLSNVNTHKFLESLAISPFMCNSDKYSFIFNLKNLPKQQIEMMFSMIEAEIEQINELLSQQDLLDDNIKNKTIITAYIQDLYRFFKLSKSHHLFEDIFEDKLDFQHSVGIQKIVNDNEIVRNFAEYFFEEEYFQSAIEIYQTLEDKSKTLNPEILEKMGYSYFKLKQYDKALGYFIKAELFDSNRVWNLKQIALCYQYLNEEEKAMKYLLDAERLDADNISIKKNIAVSYLHEEKFEKALEYFLKIDEAKPNSIRNKRSIVWCAFVVGKIELAEHYASKTIENNPNPHDLINYGHIQWIKRNMDEVLKYYSLSVKHSEGSLRKFLGAMQNDKSYLIKNGIKEEDIPIIVDYIRYKM